jgi:transmembrane sensor
MNKNELKLRILALAKKMQDGTITKEEKKEFELWYNSFDDSFVDVPEADDLAALKERIYEAIEHEIDPPEKKTTFFNTPLFKIAAILLCVLTVGGYFYTDYDRSNGVTLAEKSIKPGSQKAILILADGSEIPLDKGQKNELLTVAGTKITNQSGQLIYSNNAHNNANTAPVFHTILVPKGGTYELSLPDGTKVWLNAASSLKYPTEFNGLTREVELTGEAYFEVSRNPNQPFIVKNEKLDIEVLGTHFNVNAYTSERETKTTLFEGKVKVILPNSNFLLSPMQQAVVNASNAVELKKINNLDAISWKDGFFVFENESISNVMQKIARWYDVELVYEGKQTQQGYIGKIPRSENISEVLKMLSLTKTVHFKIEGRRIIVMN